MKFQRVVRPQERRFGLRDRKIVCRLFRVAMNAHAALLAARYAAFRASYWTLVGHAGKKVADLTRAKTRFDARSDCDKRSQAEPRISEKVEKCIRGQLRAGKGINKVAREVRVGIGTVHRIAKEMRRPFDAAA